MSISMPLYTQNNLSAEDNVRHHRQGGQTLMTQHSQSPVSTPRSVDSGLPTTPTESFAERQIVHFAMVLGRKWACTEPGHEMCFTGQGKHVPLTDDMIMAWVTALCNGEATTHIPPFILPEENLYSTSSALQAPRLRSYPSSSRISAISSSTSTSTSGMSFVSGSSFYSAATGATSSSQGEGGSTLKYSPIDSEQGHSPTLLSSSPMSASSFQPQQQLSPSRSRPQPVSPLSVTSLRPPRSTLLNAVPSARSDSPAHSLNSDFSQRLNQSLQQLQQPHHHSPYRHASLPMSYTDHQSQPSHISHQTAAPPPPRPPRNQDRPQSPEIHTRQFEQPRTPPRTPPKPAFGLASAAPQSLPLPITPTRSGQSFKGLSSQPYTRSYTYPSPSHPTSTSTSTPTSHSRSSYSHPSRMTNLAYVREEEGFDSNQNLNRTYNEGEDVHGVEFGVDGGGEGHPHDSHYRADDHPSLVDNVDQRAKGGRGAGGKSDTESHGGSVYGDAHDSSDHGSLAESEGATQGGGRSIWSPYTSFLPSLVTAVGGGNAQTPSITSTVKTKWIESAALSKRAKNHLKKIQKWRKRAITVVVEGRYSKRGKEGAQVGTAERSAVIEMIGDALEMARSCYSPRIHKLGYELGKEVQQWLQTFTDNDPAVLYKKENISLLTTVQTCFLPILLMRLAELEPSAAILANNLIVSLTKVPLSLHENEIQPSTTPLFTSPPSKPGKPNKRPSSSGSGSLPSPASPTVPFVQHRTTSISSIAIHFVARELGSASPICPSQHPWLGMTLLKIVEMSMKIRHISVGEMEDIRAVAQRREEEYSADGASFPAVIDKRITRPWEVALFAICAMTEESPVPFFRRMVLGPTGIPLFVKSLDSLLLRKIDMDDVKWEDVGLTLRALAFVSEQAWVVQGMTGGEEIIKSTMGVFWRDIPERWFSIRFWAMDAVRNIVSHRPPLVRLLADMKADQAFITLTPTSSLYPSVINTTRMEAGEKVRNKMLEEYRKESAKRAQEMVDYIRMFHDVSDRQNTGTHVVLQPVSIGFDGR